MMTALLTLLLTVPPPPPSSASLEPFFRGPDRVQIFLADMSFDQPNAPRRKKGRRIPVGAFFVLTREGPELSPEQRQELARDWVSPDEMKLREPRDELRCAINPDIGLRFWRGKTWIDLVVCFGCGHLMFYDAQGKDIDGGHLEGTGLLRRLATQAFPKEKFRD